MTVVYDAATEQQRSASAAVATFSHTAGAGVKGVLIGFVRGGAASTVSAVSYGGTTLVQVNKASDTATEPGSAEWWFAPHTATGAQTVSYSTGATVQSNIHAVAITLKGDASLYVQGAQTKAENTASISVSLTTGYVSGMAFGAFFGGGEEPATFSYAVDRSLIHDWDFGAFYSEVFRKAAVTPAGTGPLEFGGDPKANDDVAFAAVYVTDGAQEVGTPQHASMPVVVGLAPTIVVPGAEATVTPGLGSVAIGGLVARATGVVLPDIVALGINSTGQAGPLVVPLNPPVNTHEPTLVTELRVTPAVGDANVAGRAPTLATETVVQGTVTPATGVASVVSPAVGLATSRSTAPGLGAVATAALAPTLRGERTIAPATAGASVAGLAPALRAERTISPATGSAQVSALVPTAAAHRSLSPAPASLAVGGQTATLTTERRVTPAPGTLATSAAPAALMSERRITPATGALTSEGHAPSVAADGAVVATVTPATALIGIESRAPALGTVTGEAPRGHAGTGRRWRTRYYGERSASDESLLVLNPEPVPPAPLPPPEPVVLAAIPQDTDLPTLHERVARLETEAARRARRRREEEEILRFLLRVA